MLSNVVAGQDCVSRGDSGLEEGDGEVEALWAFVVFGRGSVGDGERRRGLDCERVGGG